jgi:NAD(P)-dependent dehydrogenase (short-subunit alcohol dehydrogenase family)
MADQGLNTRLDGKVAVITGAASGIGHAIARAMAADGAAVVLVGRTAGVLEEIRDEIAARGGEATVVAADLAQHSAADRVVQATTDAFGRLDVLIHSAGLFLPGPLEDSVERLDEQWAVNVRAPYALTVAALPLLRPGGSVIFLSSMAGKIGFPSSSAYCVCKGAIEMMVRALAVEEAPNGVRVNAIAPGNIATPMNAHLFEQDGYEDLMLRDTPAGRIGHVDDIAPAAVFLASDAATYLTGESITIDGGWTAR